MVFKYFKYVLRRLWDAVPTISKFCIIAANNIGHTNQITDSSLLSSTCKYSGVVLVFRFSKYLDRVCYKFGTGALAFSFCFTFWCFAMPFYGSTEGKVSTKTRKIAFRNMWAQNLWGPVRPNNVNTAKSDPDSSFLPEKLLFRTVHTKIFAARLALSPI